MAKKVLPKPTANAGGPYTVTVNIPVNVTGAASTSVNGPIKIYKWNWGDGSKPYVSVDPTAAHTYKSVGKYKLTLVVEDSVGKLSNQSVTYVTVQPAAEVPNRPPRAVLTVTGTPLVGELITASTQGTNDPDGVSLELSLDWGDGSAPDTSTAATSFFTHTYTEAGSYTITLTATDANDESNSASVVIDIDVQEVSNPPVAKLTLVNASALGAATLTVDSSEELTSALALVASGAISPGSIIDIAPGVYEGSFILPVHAGTDYITLRSSGDLPEGRVSPSDIDELAVIKSMSVEPPIATATGANHYRLIGLGFTHNGTNTYDLLRLGTSEQTSLADVPYNIEVDRCYFYVDGTDSQRRGIGMNSGYTVITNCYIENIKDPDSDSQGISCWNGPGPFVIKNNFVEAASENILFGGSDPAITNLIPTDITIVNNTITKRLEWNGVVAVKNLFEIKSARNVEFAGNTLSNCWISGQDGYAIVITPANQSGGAPWTTIEDVLIEYNTITNVDKGCNISGEDVIHGSEELNNVTFRNNVIDAAGWCFIILHSPNNLTIDNNTALGSRFLYFGDKLEDMVGFVCTDNLALFGDYGVLYDSVGTAGLDNYCAAYTFTNNVLAGMELTGYTPGEFPATTSFPTIAEFEAEFVDYANGDYNLINESVFEGQGVDFIGELVDSPIITVSTEGTTGTDLASGFINWGDSSANNTWTGSPDELYVHTYTASGTYTITLSVTDALSRTATASLVVTIVAEEVENTPPSLSISALTSPITDSNFFVSLTAADSDGTVVAGSINWGDNSSSGIAFDPETGVVISQYSHTYTSAGAKTITASVTDDDGATTTTSIGITVADAPNVPPSVAVSYLSGQYVGQPFTVAVTASDTDGTIVSWSMNWGNGTTSGSGTPASTMTRTYNTAGTFTPTLTVTDDDGATAVASVTLVVQTQPVNNQPPTGTIVRTAGQFVGDTYIFVLTGSDPDGSLASGSVDFGDSTAPTVWTGNPPSSVTHVYTTAGTRTVTYSITDNKGATTTKTLDAAVASTTTSQFSGRIAPNSSTWPSAYPSSWGGPYFQLFIIKTAGEETAGCTGNSFVPGCDPFWVHMHHHEEDAEDATLDIHTTNGVTGLQTNSNCGIEVRYYSRGIPISDWTAAPFTLNLNIENPALASLPNGIHDITCDVRTIPGINAGSMDTTVASAASTTVFTVTDAGTAAVNDYVVVEISGPRGAEVRKITAKTGNQLTVNSAFSITPFAGSPAKLVRKAHFRPHPIYMHLHIHDNPLGQSTVVPLLAQDNEYAKYDDVQNPRGSVEYVDANSRNIRTWPLLNSATAWTEIPDAQLAGGADLYLEEVSAHTDLFHSANMWWEEPPSSPDAGLVFARSYQPKWDETHRDPNLRITWGHERMPFTDGGRGKAWVSGYWTGMCDTSGNLWFVEPGGRFAKMDPTGHVTTYAGWRVKANRFPIWVTKPLATIRGNMDLVGTWPASHSEGFRTPLDVAQDPQNANHFYIVAEGDNAIFKVDISTTTPTITVFAGATDRTAGYVNATGTSARFSGPTSACWDLTGTFLYVADQKNDCVRKISRTGVVTTFIGQGPSDGTKITELQALGAPVFGSPGNYAQNRALSTTTGTNPDTVAPMTVRMDSLGNLILLDVGLSCIRRINTSTTSAELITTLDSNRYTSFADVGWIWMDVDRWGNSGPLNGIYYGVAQGSGVTGTPAPYRPNEAFAWSSSTGDVHWIFGPDVDYTPDGWGQYYYADPPHYFWSAAVDPRGGVLFAGVGEHGTSRLRKRRTTDPTPANLFDYFQMEQDWVFGPTGGPSMSLRYGDAGHGYLGFASSWDITDTTTDADIVSMFQFPDEWKNDATKKAQAIAFLRANRGPKRS